MNKPQENPIMNALRFLRSYNVETEVAGMDVTDILADLKTAPEERKYSDNMCILTRSSVVTGNISSDTAVSVSGKVSGNITTSSDLGVNGMVIGDVSARNINFNKAAIRGNTNASSDVSLENACVVIGDMEAENIVVEGKIKGNVHGRNKVSFLSKSYIVGGVRAKRINMDDGAVINATITIESNETTPDEDFGMVDFDI